MYVATDADIAEIKDRLSYNRPGYHSVGGMQVTEKLGVPRGLLSALLARIERAEARVKALEEALADCASWFKEYGDGHTAKGDADKAQRNYDRERRARIALEGT